jgi:hypothetical protein
MTHISGAEIISFAVIAETKVIKRSSAAMANRGSRGDFVDLHRMRSLNAVSGSAS